MACVALSGGVLLLLLQVQAAWRTDEIRRQKPTPQVRTQWSLLLLLLVVDPVLIHSR
jgi:phosphoenolpyruvate carboxylase